jgi:hypothetical protein
MFVGVGGQMHPAGNVEYIVYSFLLFIHFCCAAQNLAGPDFSGYLSIEFL